MHLPEKPVIEFDDVSFTYGGPPVLENISFALARGTFTSIVGPNGGGKSTLLKLILGLLTPDSGRISVLGGLPRRAGKRIGYMPQNLTSDPFFPVSVTDLVLMGRLCIARNFGPYTRADKEAARAALDEVQLSDIRNRQFSTLSGGQQRRALLARAIAPAPELLLLDEPTAGLDMKSEVRMNELLGRLSSRMTILLVSHNLGFVTRFTKNVICVKGTVAVHPTEEITSDLLDEVYGGNFKIVRHDHDCTGEDCR